MSSLLAELQPPPGALLGETVRTLRHEVEFSPLPMLPALAQEALDVTDMICGAVLAQGDANEFCRCLATAAALRDFTIAASLLP